MATFHIISVALILAVAIFLTVRRLSRRVSAPSCPRCFYNVTGLVSGVCPECGANLNEVGVLEPGHLKPLGRVAWALMWTALVIAIALLVSPAILRQIPKPWSIVGQCVLSSPASGLYESVTISADHVFRTVEGGRAPVLWATLKGGRGASNVMKVDYENLEARFTDGSGKEVRRPLTFENGEPAATVLAWLEANAISANKAVRAEAAQVATRLADHMRMQRTRTVASMARGFMSPDYFAGAPGRWGNMRSSGYNSSGAFRSRSDNATMVAVADPWPLRVLVLGWVGFWLAGTLMIWRRVGRRLRQSMPGPRIGVEALNAMDQRTSAVEG